MKESDKRKGDMATYDSAPADEGDVETAGETTAADTITGPTDTRPVGADTMLKVAGTEDCGRAGVPVEKTEGSAS